MPDSIQFAIVAALERELHPLTKSWRLNVQTHAGRAFRFFEREHKQEHERDHAVAVCGGIGPGPARRATEAVISLYSPKAIYSAGFAGALDPGLKTAAIVTPRRVVDAADGSSLDTGVGEGVLISFSTVASAVQKAKLRDSFAAQAVDMEAAAVARAAQLHGIPFAAIKAISDEAGFQLPPMERFTAPNGEFQSMRFAVYAAIRPWLWSTVIQLARNSDRASRALCAELERLIANGNPLHLAQEPVPTK